MRVAVACIRPSWPPAAAVTVVGAISLVGYNQYFPVVEHNSSTSAGEASSAASVGHIDDPARIT